MLNKYNKKTIKDIVIIIIQINKISNKVEEIEAMFLIRGIHFILEEEGIKGRINKLDILVIKISLEKNRIRIAIEIILIQNFDKLIIKIIFYKI